MGSNDQHSSSPAQQIIMSATREFTAVLSPSVGYGVVVGIGAFFALLMSTYSRDTDRPLMGKSASPGSRSATPMPTRTWLKSS